MSEAGGVGNGADRGGIMEQPETARQRTRSRRDITRNLLDDGRALFADDLNAVNVLRNDSLGHGLLLDRDRRSLFFFGRLIGVELRLHVPLARVVAQVAV